VEDGEDRRGEIPRQSADECAQGFEPAGRRADDDDVFPHETFLAREGVGV
jgi:hypothetical protein